MEYNKLTQDQYNELAGPESRKIEDARASDSRPVKVPSKPHRNP